MRLTPRCHHQTKTPTGVAALYKGLAPTLLKSGASSAVIFAFYEGLKGKL